MMENLTDNRRRELGEEEFRRLFTKCRPVFVRIADSYIHDAHTAEDIVDESFIRLWEKKDETYTDNWEAYTFRIIINRCLDHLKSRSIRTSAQMEIHEFRNRMQMYEITSLQGFNPDRIFAAEVKNLFWKCIRSMPEQTRNIFIASRFDGKTYSEIAADSGISVRQVTSHIQYALKMLRGALKDYL